MLRTVVDQIECTRSGELQVRLLKQVIEGAVSVSEPHRLIIEPGEDIDARVADVNSHLDQLGFPAIDEASVARIKRLAAVEHPAPVVEAFALLKRARQQATDKEFAALAAVHEANKARAERRGDAERAQSNAQTAAKDALDAQAAAKAAREAVIAVVRGKR